MRECMALSVSKGQIPEGPQETWELYLGGIREPR